MDGLHALKRHAMLARALIGVYLAAGAAGLLLRGLAIFAMSNPGGFMLVYPLLGLAGLASGLALLLSAIFVSLWIYRAHANLVATGMSGLRYSPGWSVGSFFVPIVNLAVPFRAMRELANRSDGEDEYQATAAVGDVSSWWSCLLGGTFVNLVLAIQLSIDAIPFVHVTTPPMMTLGLAFFAQLLVFASAVFLFRVVGSVTRAQMSVRHVSSTFA